MEELLKSKLDLVKELKNFTKEIMGISPKNEYDKVNSMIDERQKYIEKINELNAKISEIENKDIKISHSDDVKTIKKEMRLIFSEIADMDNLIRKNINDELKNVKKNLNQPEATSKSLNVKV